MYHINNHRLIAENVDFQRSPNHGGSFDQNALDTIIIHYTAGSSRNSAVRTLKKKSTKASAHLVVGRDRKITQLIPFDTIAWHAGRSSYKDKTGLNKYSIGIEIDNAGPLQKSGDKYYSWFGKAYSEEEVIKAVHRHENEAKYWHRYSEWQMNAVREICLLLIEEYPSIRFILGHEEVSPNRKIDPGPAFFLDQFRQKILHLDRSEDKAEEHLLTEGKVSASSLNIRANADGESEKIAQALKRGTPVEILEEKDGWYRVRTNIEGWVYGKYIK